MTLVKCFPHVSKKAQSERLPARLDDPTKCWKYNPGDVDEFRFCDAYQEAYSDALTRCNTVSAPLARHPVGPEVVPELGSSGAARRNAGEP